MMSNQPMVSLLYNMRGTILVANDNLLENHGLINQSWVAITLKGHGTPPSAHFEALV